jgi:S1-C subfamily serine protease
MKALEKFKKKLSALLKKAESKPALTIAALTLTALAFALYPFSKSNDITASSVMITNIAGNSGGTGIILNSSNTHSEVLTNSHVCHVVEKGGLVTGQAGTFMVATYAPSQVHDLCLVTVEGDLKANTKIANRPPLAYYENAFVSGHPALMPNVITTGHFSGRKVISVMKGLQPCTDEQANDPNTAFLCAFVGGLPVIMQYDSMLVTATIMPGSSGSGIYNSNKELSAVVFAGQGDLGYAWAVPYEAMKAFLDVESKTLAIHYPDNSVDISGLLGSKKSVDESTMIEKLKEVCKTPKRIKIKNTCELVEQNIIWNKE